MSKCTDIELYKMDYEQKADYHRRLLQERFKDIATSIYEYEGLPEGLDNSIVEDLFYEQGVGCFFEDNLLGLLFLKISEATERNVYGRPTKWRPLGFGGYTFKSYTNDNSVLVKANKSMQPTRLYVDFIIDKLVNIDATRDINLNGIKTPYVFEGSDSEILSMKNLFKKITGNAPVVYKNKTALENTLGLKVSETEVTYHGAELCDLENYFVCKLLTFLGINNSNIDKKERTNTDEVNANNQFIEINLDLGLKSRQAGFDAVNKMFGTNIVVKVNEKLVAKIEETVKIGDNKFKEGDNDEQ